MKNEFDYLTKFNESKRDDGKYVEEKVTFKKKIFFEIIKRLFDILVSFFCIILLLLPMLVIAIIIKIDSKGPAFYCQERLGKNGKKFKLIKFRSMRIDAEKDGAKWADKDDPRVTKIGKKLRSTRLDELPQVFNIFVGNMCFVGPRPERECFYNDFETYIDGFKQRLLVKPGLTGFAQINGGYDLKPEEKIIYDLEYIKKRNAGFDIKLIFKTVLVVFNHKGAR